jgi:hypothetical protein
LAAEEVPTPGAEIILTFCFSDLTISKISINGQVLLTSREVRSSELGSAEKLVQIALMCHRLKFGRRIYVGESLYEESILRERSMNRTLAQYVRIGLFLLGIFRFFIQDSMAKSYGIF